MSVACVNVFSMRTGNGEELEDQMAKEMERKPAMPKTKTGPKEQRLKLRGDWTALVGKALARKRPKKGWAKS